MEFNYSNPSTTARSLAISQLKRAASARDNASNYNSQQQQQQQSQQSNSNSIDYLSPSSSSNYSHRHSFSEDRPLNLIPNVTPSLERTASLLARSIAMAKLTGEAPPTPPANFYSANNSMFVGNGAPLPTLEALRERAASRKALGEGSGGLRRNNTVTGVGSNGTGNDLMGRKVSVKSNGDERAEARVNLMRKLSSRRLESPAPSDSMRPEDMPKALEVVGRRGRARPRSSSLPLDWIRAGSNPDVSPVHAIQTETLPLFTPESNEYSPNTINSTTNESTGSYHPQFNHNQNGSTIPITETNLSQWDQYRPSTEDSDSAPLRPPISFESRNFSTSSRNSELSSVTSLSSSTDQIPVILQRGSSLPRRTFSTSPSSNGITFPTSISSFSSLDPVIPPQFSSPTKALNIVKRPSVATFGIAAVEESLEGRRRGSSASSSLTGHSDMIANHRAMSNATRSGSGLQTSSSLGINDVLGGSTLSFGLPVERSLSRSDDLDSIGSDEPVISPPVEKLARIERKRESGMTRSRDGAFPPPEEGYQFPGPSRSGSLSNLNNVPASLSRSGSHSGPTPPPSAELSATLRQRLQSQHLTSSSGLSTPSQLDIQPLKSQNSNQYLSQPQPSQQRLSPSPAPTQYLSPSIPSKVNSTPSSPIMNGVTSSLASTTILSKSDLSITDVVKQRVEFASSSEESVAMETSYSSSNEMVRDLSSSSSESLAPIVQIRHQPLSSEQLPKNRILAKLESILGPQELDPLQPSILDKPPRHLVLHTPILQVVNASTVKDRHLFLFSDLLIIAKPIIEFDPITSEPKEVNLDTSFSIKSVVELMDLRLSAVEEVVEETKQRHPLLVEFVDRFANDPKRAINSLVQKGKMANDGPTIANLLFRNQDLNRNQVGLYLSSPDNRHVLRSYIERFRFNGVRIDDAIRMFYLAIRLPNSKTAIEYVLGVVSNHWTEVNISSGFDSILTTRLVFSIMSLSEILHPTDDEAGLFNYSTTTMSVEEFITNFRKYDPRLLVPEDLLNRIYASVRQCRIEPASDNSIFTMTPDIEATIAPTRLPSRLTYKQPSELITIKIPKPDSKFGIKLHGTDLIFDPPYLSFNKSATQSFRVTGCALGIRAMVLIKQGENAPRYQGLPLNKAFSVERAFMQHTFQLSFVNHLDVKRKYMFSTSEASIRTRWIKAVRECTQDSLQQPLPTTKALLAAQTVAGQVLRDVLIPATIIPPLSSAAPKLSSISTGLLRPGTRPSLSRSRASTPRGSESTRSNSFSQVYAFSTGMAEAELGNNGKFVGKVVEPIIDSVAIPTAVPVIDKGIKTGHEIALITEQNSLLPIVLSFLSKGASAAPHPMSTFGSAFQLPPKDSFPFRQH